MTLRLPISVYQYDKRSRQYMYQACLQFTVSSAPMPTILTSSASQGMLSENVDLLKEVMRAPAIILNNGTRTRIYNVSFEEVLFENHSLVIFMP